MKKTPFALSLSPLYLKSCAVFQSVLDSDQDRHTSGRSLGKEVFLDSFL